MATILIADNRSVNRQYLVKLLQHCGHRVLEAGDGGEALRLIRLEHPDLVISDILLPVMNGPTLARKMRAAPESATVPVMFYTAAYRIGDAQSVAEECGVKYVLTKPSEAEAILRVVNAALGIEGPASAPGFAREPAAQLGEGIIACEDSRGSGMRLSALVELGLDLAGERVPEVLVEKVCHAAQDIIGSRYSATAVLDGDGRTFKHFFESGTCSPKDDNWVSFAEHRPTFLVGRASERGRFCQNGSDGCAEESGSCNWLAARIHGGRALHGWLYLADPVSGLEFTDEDERIALTLGAQLAIAYESTASHANTQAYAAALEREIIRRKKAEDQLRKLSSAVENSPSAIIITDKMGRIEYVNPKFESITGYTADEVRGKNPRILKSDETTPEAYRQLWSTIRAGGEWRGEFHNKRKDGELFWEFASISGIRDSKGEITHFVAVKEDITKKKQLEAQYLRAQRLESVGALAAGVAHDLNNILAPILMSAPLLRKQLPPESFETVVANIEMCARRGAELVKQVLACGRGSPNVRRPVKVQHLLREMEKVAGETFPKTIRTKVSVAENLWNVFGDATQIHQVLMNLCVNARDAMPEGGKLRLQASNLEVDGIYASMVLGGRPGSFVVLEISDTGTGISPEVRDHIFEPFSTTKAEDHGTGLGLATVRRIVEDHKGYLTVQSKLGKGTTFRIFLPAALDGVGESEVEESIPEPAAGNGELILVVDDEASILTITKTLLESHGYEVLVAGEGPEAVGMYAQNFQRIALVLTDIVMPMLDGAGLIAALRRINPAMKVIAVSGHAENGRMATLKSLEISALLMKPYSAVTLLTAIAKALKTGSIKEIQPAQQTDPPPLGATPIQNPPASRSMRLPESQETRPPFTKSPETPAAPRTLNKQVP